jgi:CubicO group peptidase (beta-lactamase class C family)
LKKTFLFCIFSILLSSCQQGKSEETDLIKKSANAVPAKLDPNEIKKYHDLVSHFLDSTLLRGKFNGAILVAKDGVTVYEEYIGYKNILTKDTLTAENPLQIASTTKTLTAAAILRLVQEGKLDLNAPVQQFYPSFPYIDVTVKSLLNHRSGLPNYLYYMESGGWDRKKKATNTDILNTLIEWQPPRAYKPNANFNYCNTNYVILALLVEKISGTSFPEYMRKTFFEPLGMKHTYVHTINDSARTTPSFDGYGKDWQLDFSDGPYGDKNIYSTVQDLLKWDQAWYNGVVLNEKLVDSAFTPYSNERPSMHNYGLGWRLLMMPNNKKVIYHHGRWHGFNSAFARLPDEKVTIIILSNKFNRNVYSVARNMYNLFGDYDGKGVIAVVE